MSATDEYPPPNRGYSFSIAKPAFDIIAPSLRGPPGVSLVCTFLITPFLGRKIAYDEEFKEKYVPSWYDFTVERPKNAWTKEELQREITMLQTKLHERAIAGEFTPEKLEAMRRTINRKPEKEEHAHFAKMHPGVDDDEELED